MTKKAKMHWRKSNAVLISTSIYIYMYFKIISIYIYIKYHMPSYACIVLIYIYSLHRLKCKIIL